MATKTPTKTQPTKTPEALDRKAAPPPNQTLYRTAKFDRAAIDEEARTAELSFSSEAPVERWFGTEVLSHERGHVDLVRLNTSAPLLVNHNQDDQVGVIDHATLKDKRGVAVVRFSSSARGNEIFQDVVDGIRNLVSVGYTVRKFEEEDVGGGRVIVRALDWTPHEISLVPVPADTTVGVGRSDDQTPSQGATAGEGASPSQLVVSAGEPKTPKKTMDKEDTNKGGQMEIQNPPTTTSSPSVVVEFDRSKVEKDAAQAERERISEITKMQDKRWLSADEATEYIRDGKPLAEIRTIIMERPVPEQPTVKTVGMKQKELRQYSLARAISMAANPKAPFDGIEAEMHQECLRTCPKTPEGFLVPLEVSTRALAATVGEGSEIVPTEVGDLIDVLRNAMVSSRLGATMLNGLTGNIQLPRVTTTATHAWDAEVDALAESTPVLDTVTLSPKRAGTTSFYSKQLLIQGTVDVENLLRSDQADGLAVLVDSGALYGSGTADQPEGVIKATGVNGVTFGAAPTWAKYVEFWRKVAASNALGGRLAFLTTALAVEKGLTIERVADTGEGFLIKELVSPPAGVPDTPFRILGHPVWVREGLTDGTANDIMVFGNWSDLIIGTWGNALDVVVDPFSRASRAEVVVTTNLFVDVAVRRPKSFAVSADSAAQ
jgi:HK97 family phage major capsid protein